FAHGTWYLPTDQKGGRCSIDQLLGFCIMVAEEEGHIALIHQLAIIDHTFHSIELIYLSFFCHYFGCMLGINDRHSTKMAPIGTVNYGLGFWAAPHQTNKEEYDNWTFGVHDDVFIDFSFRPNGQQALRRFHPQENRRPIGGRSVP